MKKALTKLLAVAMIITAVGVLTACGTQRKNDLTVAVGYQFTTLDPAINTEVANSYILTHLYSGMFRRGPDGEAINDLCESYEVSEDGLTYTFHMVPDALWSDGVPITAYDFEYSYLRALSYGADNAYALSICELMNFIDGAEKYFEAAMQEGESFDCTKADHSYVGVEAVDDTTLVLRLSMPCGYLTDLMSNPYGWFPVREDFATQHESMWAFNGGYPTSGAYTLTECNETDKVILEKNENYRFADEVNADTITFMCMPDESSRTLAYQSGEVDVTLDMSADATKSYEGTQELWVTVQPSNYFLLINSGSSGPEWANDVNIRRALALAIDKKDVVSVLGGDLYYPVLNGYVPDNIPGVKGSFRSEGDADGYSLTYDSEQAKALLAKSGYNESNPLHITYKYSNSGVHGAVAGKLQQMWKNVGIDVELQSVESSVFYDQLDQGDFQVAYYSFAFTDSAIQYLNMWVSSTSTAMGITPAVEDPVFDQMITDAYKTVDTVEFNNALHEAEDYLVEENVYLIPLFNFNTPALVQDYVKGYTMSGAYPYFAYTKIKK
ncbi:MAG: peptide ABC transporter substrate-binding protein [Oscillospiraceae bacterium]|nr:peptide ABC transporter substrate-binding protein [Oscillospiraceae bacterium]